MLAPPVKKQLSKPVFVKVETLEPETKGHTLTVKVVDCNIKLERGRSVSHKLKNTRIAECLVGDETASILVTARNEQVDLMTPGATLNMRNAKITMFKGCMRLAVDMWGRIELTDPAPFEPNVENNLSLVEYELVDAPAATN